MLAISDWVTTEFSAALSIKVRMGAIDAIERAEVLSAFEGLAALSLRVLPVESAQFRLAARLANQSALGLRAGEPCMSRSPWTIARPSAHSTAVWRTPPPP